jgi:hypothetical protein
MIPEIKKVSAELEVLMFVNCKALAQSEIPILLKRSAIGISTKVAKACRAVWSDGWSWIKIVDIQIMIQSAAEAAVSNSLSNCTYEFRRSRGAGSTESESYTGS